MSVSRETEGLLTDYAGLVRKWNATVNLVSPATLDDLEHRHIEDCRQLADLTGPRSGRWADIGSGGGFPGLVLAILDQGGAARWTLVESDQRKSTFLRSVIRDLGLSGVQVIAGRIEAIPRLQAAGLTARALAPLPRLVPYLRRHLAPGGVAWAMKGRRWREELAEAQTAFDLAVQVFPSRTDPEAAILKLTGAGA